MFIIMSVVTHSVFSAGELNITVDDSIKQGKPFNAYITVKSDKAIGAVSICFEYDDEQLKLSSASLEEKSADDYFKYSDFDGQLKFIFMSESPKNENTVRLRFSQNSNDTTEYLFYTYVIEAYSADEHKLEEIAPLSVKIEISQDENGSVGIQSVSEPSGSVSTGDNSENSRKIPGKVEKGDVHGGDIETECAEGTDDEQSGQIGGNEYYIETRRDPLENTSIDYNALIGAVVAVSVGIFVCIRQYVRLKK